MLLQFFCPRWGSEALPWSDFMKKVKTEGYDGVEFGVPRQSTKQELDEIWNAGAQNGLLLIVQHYDTYEADFEQHKLMYQQWFQKIQPYKPLFINSQTGKDFFSFGQNRTLIDIASDFSSEQGIEVYHETHRNKFSFAAHIMHGYLKNIPSLKITLDASHWVSVAETYLEDQPEAMELAIEHTHHIHGRVGHTEGPQVMDPRAPEWEVAVNTHLLWWDQVLQKRATEGKKVMTITPEFGPWPYMPHLPFTNQPITNQWNVNAYMMRLLKERYKA